MKKFIFFDIDGTLLNTNKQALESTKQALAEVRQNGHETFIATGRGYGLAQNVISELGFTNYILCNGASAYRNHQLIYERPLDNETIQQLYDKCLALNKQFTLFNDKKFVRALESEPFEYLSAMTSYTQYEPPFQKDVLSEVFYQGCVFIGVEDEHHFTSAAFPKVRFVRWHPYSIDVIDKGGSKADTIKSVAQMYGIPLEDTIAFGDGLNDLEMIQTVGHGVVMNNGHDETKAVADLIVPSNDADGVYHGLKKLGLI